MLEHTHTHTKHMARLLLLRFLAELALVSHLLRFIKHINEKRHTLRSLKFSFVLILASCLFTQTTWLTRIKILACFVLTLSVKCRRRLKEVSLFFHVSQMPG